MQKPKRVTTKAAGPSNAFTLPEAKMDLEFFLKKGEETLTPDQLVRAIFGDAGFSMTDQEKVYAVLKALEDLELTMPFQFECQNCQKLNPLAIEVCQVMQTDGEPKKSFVVEFDNYIFQFERPEHIHETPGQLGFAGIGLYMMQWLVGHNQGKDFEFLHLKIGTIYKLASKFSEQMFKVSFKAQSKCAFCEHEINEDFGVSLDDVCSLVNEL